MKVKGHSIKGSVIDKESRCTHYHSEKDIIAIKFYCCATYFPCYFCHMEDGCGAEKVWPREHFNEKAVLCGSCGQELTIHTYVSGANECPSCRSEFNPNCKLHENLYFDV